jgi:hypothetical protein
MEVRLIRDGQPLTYRTPAWRGTPQLLTRAALTGSPVPGETVEAAPGIWTDAGWAPGWPGGWKNDVSTNLYACRSVDAKGCDLVAYGTTFKVVDRWLGRYLFAASGISFWDGWVAQLAAAPYPVGDLPQRPMDSNSAPLGPIAPAALPVASIRARALRRNHGLSVARVTCPVRCAVKLTVSGGGKTIRRTVSVIGTQALTIAPRRGRLRVNVVVDGKTLASGFSRAG